MKYCSVCNQPIAEGRLKALPGATTCMEHSGTERVAGYMSWEHKTAPVINIVSQEEARRVQELSSKRIPK